MLEEPQPVNYADSCSRGGNDPCFCPASSQQPTASPNVPAMRALVALPALLALLACSRDDDGAGAGAARGDTTRVAKGGAGKTVGVVIPSRGTEFWRQFEAGLKEAADKGDLQVRVESAEMDGGRQQGAVEQLVAAGADAVLLAAVAEDGAGAAISAAARARVPVFTAGIAAPGAPVVAHVASDDDGGGEVAATYLAAVLGGRAEVGVVALSGTAAGRAREAGFRRALGAHKDMRLLAAADGGGTRESARAATDALLEANPGVDALFAVTEAQTLGALDAVEARGRQELILVGYGLSPESAQAITRERPLKATVVESPRAMGMRALQVVAEHLSNEGVPPRLAVGVRLVTIDNVGKKP